MNGARNGMLATELQSTELDQKELFDLLLNYFPHNVDLMKYLREGACWEYHITQNSAKDEEVLLQFFLIKTGDNCLRMQKESPGVKPDLVLYFTEHAILDLIHGHPSASEYYVRYKLLMHNPQPGREVDNQINKSRLQLWRMGYKEWQEAYNF
jgi:hypothetical protein